MDHRRRGVARSAGHDTLHAARARAEGHRAVAQRLGSGGQSGRRDPRRGGRDGGDVSAAPRPGAAGRGGAGEQDPRPRRRGAARSAVRREPDRRAARCQARRRVRGGRALADRRSEPAQRRHGGLARVAHAARRHADDGGSAGELAAAVHEPSARGARARLARHPAVRRTRADRAGDARATKAAVPSRPAGRRGRVPHGSGAARHVLPVRATRPAVAGTRRGRAHRRGRHRARSGRRGRVDGDSAHVVPAAVDGRRRPVVRRSRSRRAAPARAAGARLPRRARDGEGN